MELENAFYKFLVYYLTVYVRGQNVPRYLSELIRSQYFPETQLREIQEQKLSKLLEEAGMHVPEYKEKLRRVEVEPGKMVNFLPSIPFVTKNDLKERYHRFRSSKNYWMVTKKTTGGSTGEPLTIDKNRKALAWELAATWRGYSWAGVNIGDKQARFWGVPLRRKERLRAKLIDIVCHRKRLSAFSFDGKILENYVKILSRYSPDYYYGYVSMIEEYAKFMRNKGIALPKRLKCVITTSEVLSDYHRKLIGEVFETKVFNEYGSGELGSVAHECEFGSMHISAENMIVEIVKGEKVCEPGEIGEIVVTELNNYAMPLIRYRTGDFASLRTKRCECGRGLPIIDKLYGRAYDTLVNKDGKLFHGEFIMYIMEEAQRRNLGIERFQVVQEDFDRILVKTVPGQFYGPPTEAFITDEIHRGFGANTMVEFRKVTRINREKSGKMRVIVGLQKNGNSVSDI